MSMLDTIHAKRDEIYNIAKKHQAERLWVFGSVARKAERPDSDVDFLAEFTSGLSYFGLCDFEDELKKLLHCPVQIVSHKALDKSPCFAYNVRKDMLLV